MARLVLVVIQLAHGLPRRQVPQTHSAVRGGRRKHVALKRVPAQTHDLLGVTIDRSAFAFALLLLCY